MIWRALVPAFFRRRAPTHPSLDMLCFLVHYVSCAACSSTFHHKISSELNDILSHQHYRNLRQERKEQLVERDGCCRPFSVFFIILGSMFGFTLFAAHMVASLGISASSSSLSTTPSTEADQQQGNDEFMKRMPRNDSEFSLGLNRNESVSAGLRELGQPCFYCWPEVMTSIVHENAGSIFVGICLTVIVAQLSRHHQHHQVDK